MEAHIKHSEWFQLRGAENIPKNFLTNEIDHPDITERCKQSLGIDISSWHFKCPDTLQETVLCFNVVDEKLALKSSLIHNFKLIA